MVILYNAVYTEGQLRIGIGKLYVRIYECKCQVCMIACAYIYAMPAYMKKKTSWPTYKFCVCLENWRKKPTL